VTQPLKVLGFNCRLKGDGGQGSSSTDVLLRQIFDALGSRRNRRIRPRGRSQHQAGRDIERR
jgi:hypothetical protein